MIPETSRTTITIERLRCYAYHGVMEQERRIGNDYEVSISLHYPAMRAVIADDLSGTVDYSRVCDIIRHTMSIPSHLLEHVCGRLIDALTREYPLLEGGKVTVSKLTPPLPGASIASATATVEW